MSGFKSFLFVSKRINLSLDVHKDVVLETEQLDIPIAVENKTKFYKIFNTIND